MKIYTSYYANIRHIPDDYFIVATSGAISDEIASVVDSWDRKLAPSKDIYFEYKDNPDWEKYTRRFKEERLKKIDWLELLEKWEEIANQKNKPLENIVLCCYEKPTEFCHRHILSEDLEKLFKTEVKEFGLDRHERVDYKMQPMASTDFLF